MQFKSRGCKVGEASASRFGGKGLGLGGGELTRASGVDCSFSCLTVELEEDACLESEEAFDAG